MGVLIDWERPAKSVAKEWGLELSRRVESPSLLVGWLECTCLACP